MLTSLKFYPRLTVPVTNHLSKYLHRENQPYRILSHFPSNLNPAIYLMRYPIFIEPYFSVLYVQALAILSIYKELHSSQKGVNDQGIHYKLKIYSWPKLGKEFDFFRDGKKRILKGWLCRMNRKMAELYKLSS